MSMEVQGLRVHLTGSVGWPPPDEMRAKLRQVWGSYQTLEAQEMLRAVDTLTDAEVFEAYKTVMASYAGI